MKSSTIPGSKAPDRRPGRPRRLELDQILDAALQVGINDLTMSKVASALGVAKAVLYNYVSSREELVHLAAARAAQQHPFPGDAGQPWDAFVLAYAGALLEYLSGDGHVLATYAEGGFGPVLQTTAAETWLSVLTRQGFSGPEALRLQQSVETVITGSALNRLHMEALVKSGGDYASRAVAAVRGRGKDELPLLHRHVDAFAGRGDSESWRHPVRLLIAGAAAANPRAAAFLSATGSGTRP